MTAPIYSYRHGPPKAKSTRQDPEHALQVSVKQFLVYCLPDDVEWTASLSGAFLGPSQRAKMKASGLRPGFPDICFVWNQRSLWIELKKPTTNKSPRLGTLDDPDLSEDQRRVLSRMHPKAYAICRSLDDVAAFLVRSGIKLKAMPF